MNRLEAKQAAMRARWAMKPTRGRRAEVRTRPLPIRRQKQKPKYRPLLISDIPDCVEIALKVAREESRNEFYIRGLTEALKRLEPLRSDGTVITNWRN